MIRNNRVTLLQDIVINKKLPKYQVTEKPKSNSDSGISLVGDNSFAVPFDNSVGNGDERLDMLEHYASNAPTMWNKFKLWIYRKFYYEGKKNQKKT